MAPRVEKRVDADDGAKYTEAQFIEYYGQKQGSKRWNAAAGVAAPKAKVKAKAKVKSAKTRKALPKIKLTYFGIEGAAEKVRLALHLGKVEFEDERIDRQAWGTLKPTTKFGQLPLMSIDDGEPLAQSGAMLRYAGKLGGLYPTHPAVVQKIEEVIGLQEDVARAMAPALYMGMRPHVYGYDENMPEAERKTIQAKLRAALVKDDLPRMFGYFEAMLEKNGTGFFVGKKPTIADCQVIPMLRTIKKGVQDGIPTTLFEDMPNLKKFYETFHEIPEVKAYYGGAAAP